MYKLDQIELPSKYLTCYESVLMTLLKAQGIHEEAAFMGTQATFLFSPDTFSVSAKMRSVDVAWQLLYGLELDSTPITDAVDLEQKLIEFLNEGTPVCVPVDLFVLPHTLHYQQLHQHHYVNLFAYKNGRFYMVCPYYRFQDWVDAELIIDGFFSDVVRARAIKLITIPQFTLPEIDHQLVYTILEENCQSMLNLTMPSELVNVEPQFVGLHGIKTFTTQLAQLAANHDIAANKTTFVNLSRHVASVGHARYWLGQLLKAYHPSLLSNALEQQFADSTQAWKAVGMQLGMVAHGERPELMQRVLTSLQTIQQQEMRLFNTLLGVLPTYEQGTL